MNLNLFGDRQMSEKLYQAPYDSFDDIALLQDLLPFFDGYDKKPMQVTEEHTLETAYWMSEFCRLVYITSQGKIKDECAKINMDVKCFWQGGTEFLVAHDEEKMVIAGRGTETTKMDDICTDLQFFRVPSDTLGIVHGGFKNAIDCIYPDMYEYIMTHGEQKAKFHTGHSLGAGLSNLVATRIDGKALYTFGSPRVGNTKFALFTNIRIPHYRYVNAGDPICALPPPLLGWRHSGTMQLISSNVFLRDATPAKGFGEMLKKHTLGKVLMVLSLGKWIVMDLVAEHNILSYNNFLRYQVNLPPHEIPEIYLEQVGK